MRRLPLVLLLFIFACADATGQPDPPAASPSSTTTQPVSTTSTTVPAAVTYTTGDCSTPPVTFALLCDVFELVQEHHVDAPLDAGALAAGAAVGAESFRPDYEGERPGDFRCAIPHESFTSTCDSIADHLSHGSFPVEAAVESAVSSMVELSLDPFTYYVPPELSGALTEDGIVSAVGLLLTIVDPVGSVCTVAATNCEVEVTLAVAGGPADEAGLRAGDVVESVDGESVEGLGLVDIAARLDGAPGTSVTVTIAHDEGTSEQVTLHRQELTAPSLEVEVPRTGVGYLRIPDFEADVPQFVHEALGRLTEAGVGEIVIDLRNNPGGLVDAVTIVASEFLADGLVLRSNGPAEDLDYPVLPGGTATSGIDLTVVVNGGSASAAEILAAVLQERDRATIVGTSTFGKNTVQIGFPLRNDGRLRVTIARWTTPDGESVAVTGIEPDVVVDIPTGASPTDVVDLVLG